MAFFLAIPTSGANYLFGVSETPSDALRAFREANPSAAMTLNVGDARLAPQLYAAALATAQYRLRGGPVGAKTLWTEVGVRAMRGDTKRAAGAQLALARALAAAGGGELRESVLLPLVAWNRATPAPEQFVPPAPFVPPPRREGGPDFAGVKECLEAAERAALKAIRDFVFGDGNYYCPEGPDYRLIRLLDDYARAAQRRLALAALVDSEVQRRDAP